MHTTRWWMLATLICVMVIIPLSAAAADISGPIASTRVITENSRLVGDVTCTVTGAPCITFGAPHIELRLHDDGTGGCDERVSRDQDGE